MRFQVPRSSKRGLSRLSVWHWAAPCSTARSQSARRLASVAGFASAVGGGVVGPHQKQANHEGIIDEEKRGGEESCAQREKERVRESRRFPASSYCGVQNGSPKLPNLKRFCAMQAIRASLAPSKSTEQIQLSCLSLSLSQSRYWQHFPSAELRSQVSI